MATNFWKRLLNHLQGGNRTPFRRGDKPRSKRTILHVEALEARDVPASFTAGNIAVLQLASNVNNTTGTILELGPSGANQTPVQSISIASTGTNALRFSDSGTSSFISDSNDGTQLVLAAYNTADASTSNLATTGTSLTTGTDPD